MLVIGYGNPGRGDDGLGPAFAARLAGAQLPGLEVREDYQLTVDHALDVSEAACVVFVDALMGADTPFQFDAVSPHSNGDLTSHSLTPASVLTLAATLYGKAPRAFVLGIAGEAFGKVKEGLSDTAQRNLVEAEGYFRGWLASRGVPVGGTATQGAAHA